MTNDMDVVLLVLGDGITHAAERVCDSADVVTTDEQNRGVDLIRDLPICTGDVHRDSRPFGNVGLMNLELCFWER